MELGFLANMLLPKDNLAELLLYSPSRTLMMLILSTSLRWTSFLSYS